jgi:hypothetical protein
MWEVRIMFTKANELEMNALLRLIVMEARNAGATILGLVKRWNMVLNLLAMKGAEWLNLMWVFNVGMKWEANMLWVFRAASGHVVVVANREHEVVMNPIETGW